MRNRWSAAVAGIALAVLTACGGGSGQQTAQQSEDSGPVTLRYAIWNPDQAPVMRQLAAKFTETHPKVEVQVEVTPFDQYFTKLQTAVTGGNAPDVFWLNGPNFKLYASNGAIAPLGDRIEEDDFSTSALPKSLVQLYSYNGEPYALPKDYDTIGLWYNKDLFDAAGVAHPDDTWTWETVREAAKKLTDPAKGVWGLPARLDRQENYYNTIYQAGGEVITDGGKSGYSKAATVEGLRFWTDIIADGSSPSLQQMSDTPPIQMFQSGKTAMYYGGSWRAPTFAKSDYTRDRVDVAPLPKGKKQAVIIHGLGNAIAAKTAHPDQAWEFVKFLGGEQAAQMQAESGVVIPAYEGTQEAWVKALPQYHLQVFLDAVDHAVPMPTSEDTAAWQADEVEHLTPAWAGTTDVESAAADLARAMDADLAKDKG